jgi:hypothetical protein
MFYVQPAARWKLGRIVYQLSATNRANATILVVMAVVRKSFSEDFAPLFADLLLDLYTGSYIQGAAFGKLHGTVCSQQHSFFILTFFRAIAKPRILISFIEPTHLSFCIRTLGNFYSTMTSKQVNAFFQNIVHYVILTSVSASLDGFSQ